MQVAAPVRCGVGLDSRPALLAHRQLRITVKSDGDELRQAEEKLRSEEALPRQIGISVDASRRVQGSVTGVPTTGVRAAACATLYRQLVVFEVEVLQSR